jgi:putative proteasome-type protease
VTYCLALRLDEGLIFLSDTRTNAGIDNVGTYRKLHVFQPAPDRLFVLQSAGNLGTTQQVLDLINRDLDAGPERESLANVSHLFEAALYIGKLSQSVVQQHRSGLGSIGADATASFILGGQIAGERPEITLVYPEGNYIRPSDERPFLQIGESKYGKFMLELAVRARVGMDDAIKIALSSMVSTARANLSVGPPYDLGIYHNGSLTLNAHRIEIESPYLQALQDAWITTLVDAIGELPALPFDLVDN